MLKELEEMSKGQKLYKYECKSCGFEKRVPEFILEKLRQDAFFSLGAIASLNEKYMPELICPNCGAKFEYKKTDDRQLSVKGNVTRTPFKGVLWQYFFIFKNKFIF